MQLNILNLWQSKNIPKTLGGRYKVVKKLAEGGFGKTFVARDMHLPGNPQCVVKQLKPQIADTVAWETAKRLFNAEAKVLSQLGEHDQIPRLLAHFEEGKEFYLAQELIEGELVSKELIPGQPWSETKVIAFLQDLLSVLAFVHQQQVIHRDIKPENLIRRQSDNKIVLIDFGAVKQVSKQVLNSKTLQTNLTISIGTQGYMAKEQLGGSPRYSSDVYAVGIIAIQALTGIHPRFWTEDHHTGEINWQEYVSKSVSPQLIEVLNRMVRYDFRSRYTNAGQALEALQKKLPSRLLDSTSSGQSSVNAAKITYTLSSKFSKFKAEEVKTTMPTVAVQKQERIGLASKPVKTNALQEFVQRHPINPKKVALAVAGVGVIFLGFEVLPIFKLDPRSNASKEILKKAEKAREAGNYSEAIAEYEKAITIKSDLLEAHGGQCFSFNQLKDYFKAIAACDRALNLKPQYLEALWNKGFALEKQQKYTEAIKAYDQALKIQPKNTDVLNHKGLSLLALGQSQEAQETFEKALELKNDLAEAHHGRCLALNQMGQHDKAITACDKAIAIKSDYPPALWSKGLALEKQQNYKEAIKIYDQLLQIDPKYTDAWKSKGLSLIALNHQHSIDQNQKQEALKAFESAIALQPNLAEAHWGRCYSLNLVGKFKEAINACDKALEIQPQYPEALWSKGFALDFLNQHAQALDLYEQALKINPQYAEAWNNKGVALLSLGRSPQEALDAFEQAVKFKPDFSHAWVNRGAALWQLQRLEEAIASIKKALELDPNNENAKKLLTQAQQNLGR